MTRRIAVIVVALGLLVPWVAGAQSLEQQTTKPSSQSKKTENCIDEQELTFSSGSLRKVTNQIQKCEAGIWVIDPMNGPKDPALEKAKPCLGIKDQEYAAGVLRQMKDKLERCQDGKWVAWTK